MESHNNIKILFNKIRYSDYQWSVSRDLKVIGIFDGSAMGIHRSCFLCLWESRDTAQHYETKEWPARNCFVRGIKRVQHIPLVNPDEVLVPPLKIALGLMKNFV